MHIQLKEKIYLVWLFIKISILNKHEHCHGVFTCWQSVYYVTKLEIPINISVKYLQVTAFKIKMMQIA